MGCCNPKYRETVNEEEKRINAKGLDSLSLSVKLLFGVISILGVFFYLT
ncbi:hypothetical protein KIS1582_0761 [Cytobacillus firmus]|uniref:Uncharacterized protein n=1 Tax=Cytobacillus firmus TaxID=1399 RepID=A0A800NEU9_CYTFI|nr:hypothetical protein KIS1582_0761 [Cytobacillus firmus]